MPGGSDFPRGWTVSSGVIFRGSAVSITIAAVPGVIHVLDAFFTRLVSAAAAPAGALININMTTGGNTTAIGILAGGTSSWTADDQTGTGLDLATAPGDSLVVAWSPTNVPGTFEEGILIIQGHDI